MGAFGLPIPTRDAGQAMGNVGNLNIERAWLQQIQPSSAQHPLPGPWWRALGASFLEIRH